MEMEKGQRNEMVVPIVESDLRPNCYLLPPLQEPRKADAQKQDTVGHEEVVICCNY